MIMALGLAMGPTVARGLARFAYALLRTDPWDGHSTAGVMSTANALGYYLAGALAGAPLGRRVGSRAAFVGELVVTALALVASAASANLGLLLVLRVVAGARHGPRRAAVLLGVYFAGGGAGIAV